jgi:hypothetical protein
MCLCMWPTGHHDPDLHQQVSYVSFIRSRSIHGRFQTLKSSEYVCRDVHCPINPITQHEQEQEQEQEQIGTFFQESGKWTEDDDDDV